MTNTIALGTVLPTARSLKLNDKWASNQSKLNAIHAANNLKNCTKRIVGSEVRYYATDSCYATVRNQVVRWFEVRADGDYAIKARK